MLDFLNKAKNYILEILGVLLALFVGLFLLEKKKNEASEALNENLEVKNKVQQINNEVTHVTDQIAQEEQSRSDLIKSTQEKEKENVSKDDLLSFLNNKSNQPK